MCKGLDEIGLRWRSEWAVRTRYIVGRDPEPNTRLHVLGTSSRHSTVHGAAAATIGKVSAITDHIGEPCIPNTGSVDC